MFFNRRVGLIATFLLAISVLHIEYSREARYYVYVVFFSLLFLNFVGRVWRQKKISDWLGLIVSGILSVLSHLTTLLFLAIVIFFGLATGVKGKVVKPTGRFAGLILIAVLATGHYLTSYLGLFKSVNFDHSTDFTRTGWYVLTELAGGGSWRATGYFFLFLLGLFLIIKESKRRAVFWATLFFAPVIVLSFFRPEGYGFHVRYVIFVLPIYLLVIARVLDYLKSLGGEEIGWRERFWLFWGWQRSDQ